MESPTGNSWEEVRVEKIITCVHLPSTPTTTFRRQCLPGPWLGAVWKTPGSGSVRGGRCWISFTPSPQPWPAMAGLPTRDKAETPQHFPHLQATPFLQQTPTPGCGSWEKTKEGGREKDCSCTKKPHLEGVSPPYTQVKAFNIWLEQSDTKKGVQHCREGCLLGGGRRSYPVLSAMFFFTVLQNWKWSWLNLSRQVELDEANLSEQVGVI